MSILYSGGHWVPVFACLFMLVGVGLLRFSWRRSLMFVQAYRILGLLSFAVASWIWSLLVGWEYAVVYSALIFSALGLGFVAFSMKWKPLKQAKGSSRSARKGAINVLSFIRLIAVVILAPAAASLSAVALVSLLPLASATQMVVAAFLLPLSWAGVTYMLCYSERWLRQSAALLVVTGVSSFTLFG